MVSLLFALQRAENTMLRNFFKKFHFFHLTDLKTQAQKSI